MERRVRLGAAAGGLRRLPRLDPAYPVEEFAVRLVEQEGVLLVPGSIYDYPGNRFRVGFGHADLPAALAGLERFLRRELGRRAA